MHQEAFIVLDWAGNRKLTMDEFTSFEDAWDYICERIEGEVERGEFQVIPKREYRGL